jgi:hypothetical protein
MHFQKINLYVRSMKIIQVLWPTYYNIPRLFYTEIVDWTMIKPILTEWWFQIKQLSLCQSV